MAPRLAAVPRRETGATGATVATPKKGGPNSLMLHPNSQEKNDVAKGSAVEAQ